VEKMLSKPMLKVLDMLSKLFKESKLFIPTDKNFLSNETTASISISPQ